MVLMNIDQVAGTGLAILGALWLVVSVGCVLIILTRGDEL